MREKFLSYVRIVYGGMAISALGFWLFALQSRQGSYTAVIVIGVGILAYLLALTSEKLTTAARSRKELRQDDQQQVRPLVVPEEDRLADISRLADDQNWESVALAGAGDDQNQLDQVFGQVISAYWAKTHSNTLSKKDVGRLVDRLKRELAEA